MNIWPFSRALTLPESGLLNGFTDYHCHILPGVDDGIRSMRRALEVLEVYEHSGVAAVWFTPHIMEDVPNTTASLRARFEELKSQYSGPIQLNLAAENMIDNLLLERLDTADLLPIGPNADHLLVETSYATPPANFYDVLARIRSLGFFPLLAHPERYIYLSIDDYTQLKQQGIKFQLNLMSLAGLYGSQAKTRAKTLISKGYYNCTGSDLHSLKTLTTTTSPLFRKYKAKLPTTL